MGLSAGRAFQTENSWCSEPKARAHLACPATVARTPVKQSQQKGELGDVVREIYFSDRIDVGCERKRE